MDMEQSPRNPLSSFFMVALYEIKMLRAFKIVGLSKEAERTSFQNSTLSPEQRKLYKEAYELEQEASQLAQEYYSKAGELGYAGGLYREAMVLRGGYCVPGIYLKKGSTQWEHRTDAEVIFL